MTVGKIFGGCACVCEREGERDSAVTTQVLVCSSVLQCVDTCAAAIGLIITVAPR